MESWIALRLLMVLLTSKFNVLAPVKKTTIKIMTGNSEIVRRTIDFRAGVKLRNVETIVVALKECLIKL